MVNHRAVGTSPRSDTGRSAPPPRFRCNTCSQVLMRTRYTWIVLAAVSATLSVQLSGDTRQVTPPALWTRSSPRWASKGDSILFPGGFGNTVVHLGTRVPEYYVFARGGERVTERELGHLLQPGFHPWDWSPDGLLLVGVNVPKGDSPLEIVVVPSPGTVTHRRSFTVAGRSFAPNCFAPAWSPRGVEIAFIRESPRQGGQFDLCITQVDGRRRRVLLNNIERWHTPTWSSRGEILIANREGKLVIVNARSGSANKIRLPPTYHGRASDRCWSPDGTRLAFDSSGKLVLFDRIRGRASFPAPAFRTTQPGGVRCLAWAPSGDRLAYVLSRGARELVQVVNVGTGHVRTMRNLEHHVLGTTWSRDGRRLLVEDDTGVPPHLKLVMFDATAAHWGARKIIRLTGPPKVIP